MDTPFKQPATNDEHAVHALNIHGTFFERKCQDVVHNAKDWHLQASNYPVTYGNENSNLDIWAIREVNSPTRLLLPIECKKNNSNFVDWIFFPKANYRPSNLHIPRLEIRDQPSGAGNWTIQQKFMQLEHDLTIADEARETKGNYLQIKNQQDRTKTSNAAITEAATQIAIATQALIQQEYQVLEELKKILRKNNTSSYAPCDNLLFFPTIVTTANLFICQFQNTDVNLETGEIPFEKVKLIPCPYLIFDYPVPVALQVLPQFLNVDYTHQTLELIARMSIFVVNSTSFPIFLKSFRYRNVKQIG